MNKKSLIIKFLVLVAVISSAFVLSSCFTTIGLVSCKRSCQESCNSSEIAVSGHEYGIYYTLDDSGEFYWVSEVGYKETEVKIPETYEGYPVMGIKHRAFEHYRQTGSCGGGYYFGMHLSSLTLPKTIKVIDIGVFGGGLDHNYHTEVATCDKLIYEGTIGDWCDIEFRSNPFYDGTKLYIDGELLTDLVIPETVTKINKYAFAYYGGLKSVTLHEKIAMIEEGAFLNCTGLEEISFPCKNLTVGGAAFADCEQLKKVTFMGENLVLEDGVFYSCESLEEVEWNAVNIAVIPEAAFSYCNGLKSFVIPASVAEIDFNAFKGCYNLVEVYNLSKLNIVAGSTTHGGVAQYAGIVHTAEEDNSYILTVGDYKFVVSEEKTTLFKYTGEGEVLFLPELENGKTYDIRANTFALNHTITTVIIPDCVTAIGENAFYYCDNLQLVSGCAGVVTLGNGAFSECVRLASIVLGKVEEIGDETFDSCVALKSLELPETLSKIGKYAFCNCEGITSITLPKSLTEIGNDAFIFCDAEIKYAGTLEEWNEVKRAEDGITATVTCSDGVWEGKI